MLHMPSILSIISEAPVFAALADDLLGALAREVEEREFAAGEIVYDGDDAADHLYVVRAGSVSLTREPAEADAPAHVVGSSGVFGWKALLTPTERRQRALATEPTSVVQIHGRRVLEILAGDPASGGLVMEALATALNTESRPARNRERSAASADASADASAAVSASSWAESPSGPQPAARSQPHPRLALAAFHLGEWFKSPRPYLLLLGYSLFLGFWYLAVEVLRLPRFSKMPGLTQVVEEWVSRDPIFGLSIHTPIYYEHIWVSLRRIAIAFSLATVLGVSVGLLIGWSSTFKEYVFPVFEVLRPIPILAWVPLAIIMFSGSETPVVFLTFLASFFATALNTMLGVRSIEPHYVLAASCLGASRWQVFRHVIVPGALPFIFTGLQISMGVAWFSLAAAEMVSGQFGLGYLINTSYTMVQYPTIVIGMLTLGIVGYVTSALVRLAGDRLMGWRVRGLAMGAG
jgi:NitT/TauT family transport system permease protein